MRQIPRQPYTARQQRRGGLGRKQAAGCAQCTGGGGQDTQRATVLWHDRKLTRGRGPASEGTRQTQPTTYAEQDWGGNVKRRERSAPDKGDPCRQATQIVEPASFTHNTRVNKNYSDKILLECLKSTPFYNLL